MASNILIVGATGKQGGCVIDSLLSSPDAADITIYALTRNPDSKASKDLSLKSPNRIKLVQGDLKDCPSIFKDLPHIDSVFFVSIPEISFWGHTPTEELNGKALINAAVEHGVKHFVYTSVDRHGSASDENDTNVPHFASKAHIEAHLREKCRESQMTWCILRPTAFMENFMLGFAGKVFPTTWKIGLSPSTRLQLVACSDIGYFGAQALRRAEEFSGRSISLAGDELTFEEANRIFREEVGYNMPLTYGFLISAVFWALKDVALMVEFWEKVGYSADIQVLRKEQPRLLGFRDWLKTSVFVKTSEQSVTN